MEEHRTVMRNGKDVTQSSPGHPDDDSRKTSQRSTPVSRDHLPRIPGLRRPYVAHCHNLAHEDHAMIVSAGRSLSRQPSTPADMVLG
jgi:FtsP/CotA-like multicopper oxidase with cupredoxin domain